MLSIFILFAVSMAFSSRVVRLLAADEESILRTPRARLRATCAIHSLFVFPFLWIFGGMT